MLTYTFRCIVDDRFDYDALLSISYSTFRKGMFHITESACPKWAIWGERLKVHERYWLKGILEAFLKSPVDGAKCMPMQMFPPSASSSSDLIAPATRLSQNLQHLSLLLNRDSATLTVSEAPVNLRHEGGVTNHVSRACCG
jgi:hypothetical protein